MKRNDLGADINRVIYTRHYIQIKGGFDALETQNDIIHQSTVRLAKYYVL